METNIIVTKTLQKSMNLYQYISTLSNHPLSTIKGIIYSILRTYMPQNTYEEDYQDVVVKLCTRHVA